MQLKFKMENYLKESIDNNHNLFTGFLERYIDTIYSKRNDFAGDIDITPVYLSQIINRHREPNDEFIQYGPFVFSSQIFTKFGTETRFTNTY